MCAFLRLPVRFYTTSGPLFFIMPLDIFEAKTFYQFQRHVVFVCTWVAAVVDHRFWESPGKRYLLSLIIVAHCRSSSWLFPYHCLFAFA